VAEGISRTFEIFLTYMFSMDAPGMRGIRPRNQTGPLRVKRGDTLIGTIEKKYGIELSVRSDMRLDTYLEKTGIKSLNDLINN
jgi:hypothetical protein